MELTSQMCYCIIQIMKILDKAGDYKIHENWI